MVHDMFQNRMSDTSFTRDKGSTVQIRGYKIYWLQKELHRRFDRHFEGHSFQVRGTDLLFIDSVTMQGPQRQRAQKGPSAPKPKSCATVPPWRSPTSPPPPPPRSPGDRPRPRRDPLFRHRLHPNRIR